MCHWVTIIQKFHFLILDVNRPPEFVETVIQVAGTETANAKIVAIDPDDDPVTLTMRGNTSSHARLEPSKLII